MKKVLTIVVIIAIIAVIAIAGSVVYYFVFFRTGQEKAEIRLQEQKLEIEKEKQRADEISIEKDKEDKAQQEANKEQQEQNNRAALVKALYDLEEWYKDARLKAYENYKENWDNARIKSGLPPDSGLPKDIASRIDDSYQKAIEHINEQYQMQKDSIYKLYN